MKIGDRDTPGTRIYAEREFREDGPGPGRHRGRRRRHQPPVLLVHDQLRHPLEPRPAGAAHGPHPPLRPGEGLPHLQLRLHQHPRRPGPAEALRAHPARSRTTSTRSSTGKVFNVLGDVFPANQLEKMSATCTPTTMTEEAIKERIVEEVDLEPFPRHHRLHPGGAGQAGTEPLRHRRQVGRGQGTPAGARGHRGLLHPGRRRSSGFSRKAARRRTPTSTASAACPAPLADRRTAGAPLRQAGPRVRPDRLRQGAARNRTPRWNGSRPAIRCSRPCARTLRTPGAATTCSAARSSTTCTAAALPSMSSPPRSRTAAATFTAGCSSSRPTWTAGSPSGSRPSSSTSPSAGDGQHGPGRPACRATRTLVEQALVEQALNPLLDEVADQRRRRPTPSAGTSRSA